MSDFLSFYPKNMADNVPVSLGGGDDQVKLVERWQAGEVIGDPQVVQLFIDRVLKVGWILKAGSLYLRPRSLSAMSTSR